MDSTLENIISKLTSLHKKEYAIQTSIKKQLREPNGMSKVRSRILNESKLKEVRREIEQEEYKLLEARILHSLATR